MEVGVYFRVIDFLNKSLYVHHKFLFLSLWLGDGSLSYFEGGVLSFRVEGLPLHLFLFASTDVALHGFKLYRSKFTSLNGGHHLVMLCEPFL